VPPGYLRVMTDHSSERLEAIQIVVDRVGGYQDGAPEGTVEHELRRGLTEAGVDLSDADVVALAEAIEDEDGTVDAARVLSSS
jgi:hypothetical protein